MTTTISGTTFPQLTKHLYEQITGCQHPRTEVRALTISDGRVQHVAQCLRCHQKVGGAVRQVGEVPDFDVANFDRIRIQVEEYRTRAWGEKEEQRVIATEEWRIEYSAYLKTYEWQERRARVLNRANGLCEGCNTNRATEVHHLTYRHVMAEFDNELVAYCGDCHDRIHQQGNYRES